MIGSCQKVRNFSSPELMLRNNQDLGGMKDFMLSFSQWSQSLAGSQGEVNTVESDR